LETLTLFEETDMSIVKMQILLRRAMQPDELNHIRGLLAEIGAHFGNRFHDATRRHVVRNAPSGGMRTVALRNCDRREGGSYLHTKVAPRAEDGDADCEITIRVTGGYRPEWAMFSSWSRATIEIANPSNVVT
jgi:hypothetical protein